MVINAAKGDDRKLYLPYLDGLRGIAALYIVLHHLWLIQGNNLPIWFIPTISFKFGLLSVVLFLVLSGYVLMLPVVRSDNGYIKGGLINYWKRRSLRILPTYYITLGLCIVLALIIRGLDKYTNWEWSQLDYDMFSINFSFLDVVKHILLIHNFTWSISVYHIHVPMWSIPIEWQAYILLPLIFLPLWRRWGILPVIGIAFLISLAPIYLLNNFMVYSRPWILASFTLGMAAADIGFSQKPLLIKLRQKMPWGILTLIFCLLTALTEYDKLRITEWINHSIAGLAFASLMIYCTKCLVETKTLPKPLQFLESPLTLAIAKISYSLYLSHAIVVTFIRHWLLSLQLSPTIFATLLYIIALPSSLITAYGFYLVAERPFLPHSKLRNKLLNLTH
jgi:peptidoglycan/LPS O-acetylase OafA/YrhL